MSIVHTDGWPADLDTRAARDTWLRSARDQCAAAGVPLFVKQLGARPIECGAMMAYALNDRKGGDPAEWPPDLRVREMPGAEAAR